MRSDKKLLWILLFNICKLESGLCALTSDLYMYYGKYTYNEWNQVEKIIDSYNIFFYNSYYFKPGRKFPRIIFILKIIFNYKFKNKKS